MLLKATGRRAAPELANALEAAGPSVKTFSRSTAERHGHRRVAGPRSYGKLSPP